MRQARITIFDESIKVSFVKSNDNNVAQVYNSLAFVDETHSPIGLARCMVKCLNEVQAEDIPWIVSDQRTYKLLPQPPALLAQPSDARALPKLNQ